MSVPQEKKLGLSQEKFAEKLGVTRNTVSRWERDEVSPSPENLAALDFARDLRYK